MFCLRELIDHNFKTFGQRFANIFMFNKKGQNGVDEGTISMTLTLLEIVLKRSQK